MINRDYELQDDDSISQSEFDNEDPSSTPRPGRDEEEDPYLTGSHHQAGKKKHRNGPDQGETLKEMIETLEIRWKKEDEREDARTGFEREDSNRLYGVLSSIAASFEKMTDKNN